MFPNNFLTWLYSRPVRHMGAPQTVGKRILWGDSGTMVPLRTLLPPPRRGLHCRHRQTSHEIGPSTAKIWRVLTTTKMTWKL